MRVILTCLIIAWQVVVFFAYYLAKSATHGLQEDYFSKDVYTYLLMSFCLLVTSFSKKLHFLLLNLGFISGFLIIWFMSRNVILMPLLVIGLLQVSLNIYYLTRRYNTNWK